MPWPVYSERILHHQAAGAWHFIVPPRTRLIIRSIDLVNYAAPGAIIALTIGPIFLEYLVFQASEPVIHRACFAVAYQGEDVALQHSVSGIHSTISGQLLTDDTGRTGPPLSPGELPVEPLPPLRPLGLERT